MMPPCERVLLNKIRRTKFLANIWMSSIEASFKGDLLPSSINITYKCEKHDAKYYILVLLLFDCFFLSHF